MPYQAVHGVAGHEGPVLCGRGGILNALEHRIRGHLAVQGGVAADKASDEKHSKLVSFLSSCKHLLALSSSDQPMRYSVQGTPNPVAVISGSFYCLPQQDLLWLSLVLSCRLGCCCSCSALALEYASHLQVLD